MILARPCDRGFALVELLVAVVLGLFLLGAVSQVYVSGKQTFSSGGNLARMQENARFALQVMSRDLRQSGFAGCSRNLNSVLDIASSGYDPNFYDPTQVVGGWEFNGTAPGQDYTLSSLEPSDAAATDWSALVTGLPLAADLTNRNLVPGSDVLVIKRLDQLLAVRPTANVGPAAPSFTVNDARPLVGGNPDPPIEQLDMLVVSNCQQGDLFQHTFPTDTGTLRRAGCCGEQPGNLPPGAQPFSQTYDTAADIYKFSSHAYFVAESPASGRPALFRLSFSKGQPAAGDEVELVEGVENLQVLYGVDLDADNVANRFVAADAVLPTDSVVTVRIGLLMRSNTHNAEDPIEGTATFTVTDNVDVSPTIDLFHQRYVATATVQLRNRS